ncbi:MAG TPA: Abi-alpha family protein [Bryobacteraceae bacterium]|nr:Abi-alpha family protein [Bryobacteraceae bacterium]
MDPVTKAAISAAGEKAADVLKSESQAFLSAVLPEPGKALGGWFADWINASRHKNLIKITAQAKRNLAEANLTPKEVPLNIIHPALEVASLEENDALQTVWANLLANAADSAQTNPVQVSFVSTLRELSTREVTFLESLHKAVNADEKGKRPLAPHFKIGGFTEEQLLDLYGQAGLLRNLKPGVFAASLEVDGHGYEMETDLSDFRGMMDILIRNRILKEYLYPKPIRIGNYGEGPIFSMASSSIEIETQRAYQITEFGSAFVNACRAQREQ